MLKFFLNRNLSEILGNPFSPIEFFHMEIRFPYFDFRKFLIKFWNFISYRKLKVCRQIFYWEYNKIEFWTLPRRSRRSGKHRWNLHYLLPHSHKTRLKSDFEKGYFFFELFYLLLAWLLRKRINQKRNSLFPNRI